MIIYVRRVRCPHSHAGLSSLRSPQNRKSVVNSFCFLPFECGRCTQCAHIKDTKRQCDHFVAAVLFIRFDSFHFSWCPQRTHTHTRTSDFFFLRMKYEQIVCRCSLIPLRCMQDIGESIKKKYNRKIKESTRHT